MAMGHRDDEQEQLFVTPRRARGHPRGPGSGGGLDHPRGAPLDARSAA